MSQPRRRVFLKAAMIPVGNLDHNQLIDGGVLLLAVSLD